VDPKDVTKRLTQNLQAMDNSHVALVSVKLHADGFALYRCDRPIPLGVNLGSLTKVLKCAKDDDKCTLKATDDADLLSLKYEAHRASTLRVSGWHPSPTNVLSYHRR
jgi:proliferating cell nuclear antigen